ncbi:response regulator [Thiospirochaeta perfilievii]|uniref:Response regulator n=1 Tax=Thiospirochaeta perfilievii TaxID=252967 RepID=A0A5C1Q9T5_9SPIO|nr:response regulator [Thiospirochaeta perfilievii]QEN04893.1 response regulator [Thiospirochaeta perfilievii]
MKKILIIDEAEAFRKLVEKLCIQNDLEPYLAINGLDGNSKILSIIPDLIIMDKDLTRMDSLSVLARKKNNPNASNIPVIMVSKDTPNKSFLMQTIPLGVKKFIKKPIEMESLLVAISDVLHINTEVDQTPCVLEVRLNENILFVEVAMGLNRNRLEVVKFRIAELIKLHRVKNPLVLLMLTDIPFGLADRQKLTSLIHFCMEGANIDDTKIRILTPSKEIKKYLNTHLELYDILVENNLDRIMFGFVRKTKDDLLFSQNKSHEDEAITVNYRSENKEQDSDSATDSDLGFTIEDEKKKIAIVDDDKVVHAIVKSVFKKFDWEICCYLDGDDFLKESHINEFDLIILDLLMPGVDGFRVLDTISKDLYKKTIVLTSSTQRNDVMKVLSYGIRNYSVKPINGESIKIKAFEILKNR